MHSSWSEWVIVMPWVLVPHTQAYRFKSVSQRQHPKPTFWEAGIGSWDPTHCALTSSQHCSYSLLLFLDEWRVTLNTLGPLVAQMVKNLPEKQEMQVWSLGWEDPLKKEMATHCSIPAWRIPWTEEPGGIQSTGSQRVWHKRATFAFFLCSFF